MTINDFEWIIYNYNIYYFFSGETDEKYFLKYQ